MTTEPWEERRFEWNAWIDEFERLWASWVGEKRVSERHWGIEDEIWVLHQRMLHASIVPERVEPAIEALRESVERFRVELERDPSRRGRRFAALPLTPTDFHLSERFPYRFDHAAEAIRPEAGAP
jgi:hypothetical protein